MLPAAQRAPDEADRVTARRVSGRVRQRQPRGAIRAGPEWLREGMVEAERLLPAAGDRDLGCVQAFRRRSTIATPSAQCASPVPETVMAATLTSGAPRRKAMATRSSGATSVSTSIVTGPAAAGSDGGDVRATELPGGADDVQPPIATSSSRPARRAISLRARQFTPRGRSREPHPAPRPGGSRGRSARAGTRRSPRASPPHTRRCRPVRGQTPARGFGMPTSNPTMDRQTDGQTGRTPARPLLRVGPGHRHQGAEQPHGVENGQANDGHELALRDPHRHPPGGAGSTPSVLCRQARSAGMPRINRPQRCRPRPAVWPSNSAARPHPTGRRRSAPAGPRPARRPWRVYRTTQARTAADARSAASRDGLGAQVAYVAAAPPRAAWRGRRIGAASASAVSPARVIRW